MSVVLINLDLTLLATPNTEKLFYKFMERRRMVRRRNRRQRFWFNIRWFGKYGTAVRAYNKAWLGGMRRADVDVYAEGFAKRKLKDLIYAEMWDRIEAHEKADDTLVLFSETPQCIVEQLARFMEIGKYRGTVCAYLGNLYLTTPPYTLLQGDAKVTAAKRLSQDLDTPLEDFIAYVHSPDDLPLMNAVGHPVLVNPNRGLITLAKENNWEILTTE